MTTTGIRPSGQAAPSLAVRARDLLASEWTKFWSVRSAYWTLLVAAVTPVVLSDLIAFALAQPSSKRSPGPPPDPMLPAFYSLEYAVLAVCVLGVLQFSSEYSTGLIRTFRLSRTDGGASRPITSPSPMVSGVFIPGADIERLEAFPEAGQRLVGIAVVGAAPDAVESPAEPFQDGLPVPVGLPAVGAVVGVAVEFDRQSAALPFDYQVDAVAAYPELSLDAVAAGHDVAVDIPLEIRVKA
jgi:hypothetical protein